MFVETYSDSARPLAESCHQNYAQDFLSNINFKFGLIYDEWLRVIFRDFGVESVWCLCVVVLESYLSEAEGYRFTPILAFSVCVSVESSSSISIMAFVCSMTAMYIIFSESCRVISRVIKAKIPANFGLL